MRQFLAVLLFCGVLHAQTELAHVTNPCITACSMGTPSFTSPSFNDIGATLLTIEAYDLIGLGGNPPTVTCATAGSPTGIHLYQDAGAVMAAEIFYFHAPSTSATETCTCTGQYGGCFIQAWASTGTYDTGVTSGAGGGCSGLCTGPITPNFVNDLLITIITCESNSAPTWIFPTNFYLIDNIQYTLGSTEPSQAAGYTDPSTSTINPTWTFGGGTCSNYLPIVAGFITTTAISRHHAYVIHSK